MTWLNWDSRESHGWRKRGWSDKGLVVGSEEDTTVLKGKWEKKEKRSDDDNARRCLGRDRFRVGKCKSVADGSSLSVFSSLEMTVRRSRPKTTHSLSFSLSRNNEWRNVQQFCPS